MMNEKEKSLKLAELIPDIHKEFKNWLWIPYEREVAGLAEFAAIFFAFRDVIEYFVCTEGHTALNRTSPERYERYGGAYQGYLTDDRPLTQSNFLDAVLRHKGVSI